MPPSHKGAQQIFWRQRRWWWMWLCC